MDMEIKTVFIKKTMNFALVFSALVFIGLFSGCAKDNLFSAPPSKPGEELSAPSSSTFPKPYRVFGKWYYPMVSSKGFKQQGIASWYGKEFHGKTTSNGEIYDMYSISAAHKTLPFNTYVRVHNLENNRKIDVRINDRGPFVSGRIIDLSLGAAKELGIVENGTARVRITALGMAKKTKTEYGLVRTYHPVNYYRGNFTIQVGAFQAKANAENLREKLDKSYRFATIRSGLSRHGGNTLYRVLVGKCTTLEQAQKYETIMRKKGFKDAFAIAD